MAMIRQKKRPMTELEMEIMRIIWSRGEVTVKQLYDELPKHGRPLSHQSIRTMVGILHDKGYLRKLTEGKERVYKPALSPDEGKRRVISDLIERAFGGSAWGLVSALVNTKLVSKKELDAAKKLIEEKEKGSN